MGRCGLKLRCTPFPLGYIYVRKIRHRRWKCTRGRQDTWREGAGGRVSEGGEGGRVALCFRFGFADMGAYCCCFLADAVAADFPTRISIIFPSRGHSLVDH